MKIAELLLIGFCAHAWCHYGIGHAVTVSFGVSETQDSEKDLQPAINRAEQAFSSSAKITGRNKVFLATENRLSPSIVENTRSRTKPTERISA